MESGILGFGIGNSAQGNRNPVNYWKSGIQVPLTCNWKNIKDKEPPEGVFKRKDLPKNQQA